MAGAIVARDLPTIIVNRMLVDWITPTSDAATVFPDVRGPLAVRGEAAQGLHRRIDRRASRSARQHGPEAERLRPARRSRRRRRRPRARRRDGSRRRGPTPAVACRPGSPRRGSRSGPGSRRTARRRGWPGTGRGRRRGRARRRARPRRRSTSRSRPGTTSASAASQSVGHDLADRAERRGGDDDVRVARRRPAASGATATVADPVGRRAPPRPAPPPAPGAGRRASARRRAARRPRTARWLWPWTPAPMSAARGARPVDDRGEAADGDAGDGGGPQRGDRAAVEDRGRQPGRRRR